MDKVSKVHKIWLSLSFNKTKHYESVTEICDYEATGKDGIVEKAMEELLKKIWK